MSGSKGPPGTSRTPRPPGPDRLTAPAEVCRRQGGKTGLHYPDAPGRYLRAGGTRSGPARSPRTEHLLPGHGFSPACCSLEGRIRRARNLVCENVRTLTRKPGSEGGLCAMNVGGGETAPAEGFGGAEQGQKPPGMMGAVAWLPCQGRTRRPNAKGREARRESLPREDASTSGYRPACFSPPVPFPAHGERGCCFPRGCAGAGRPRVRAGHRAWRGRCCTPSRAA